MPDLFQFFDLAAIGEYSPVVIFFIFFFATFISEDIACLTAGTLAGQGKISFALAFFACFAGIFIGDILLYWTGRIFGKTIIKTKLFSRFVSEKSIEKASDWLEKNGAAAIFLSRFITGFRLPTYLAAGFLRTDFLKFAFYFLIATAVWTPILVGSTSLAGQFFFSKNLLIVIFLAFILLKTILHFSSWKNRRLFVGKLKRIRNWEFWSLKVFYFPVVIYVLFLAIRHRSLTIFTCANPAILASGFVGESKDEIYDNLRKPSANSDFLLPHILLKPEDSLSKNISQVWQFIDENNLSFPLILKPNAGERGKGVRIAKTYEELKKALEEINSDHILQEFYDGIEASIFYIRYPNEEKGRIFSITEKLFPSLLGDGKSNLEELILLDERAVCLAKKYFEQNAARLDYIPQKDEEIQIINIGTHSRGAIFLDGGWLKTPELEEKIDEICQEFEGFYFGRFDIRAKSFADLQGGKNFKIIELNGVTSESTNIYDPKYSLLDAYRILFLQWRVAFEIGQQNYDKGCRQTSVFQLSQLIAENCFGFGSKTKTQKTVNKNVSDYFRV